MSARCGYDWYGTRLCEVRWHHRFRPSSVVAYALEGDGRIVPLYSYEASSVTSPILSLAPVVTP